MFCNAAFDFWAVRKKSKISVIKRHKLAAGFVLFSFVGVLSAQQFYNEKISVGAIFDQNTEEVQNVFKYALAVHNQNISSRRLELQAYVDVINTADAFKLSRLICNQFARGVFSMLGAVTPESFDTLHSYTNTFQMPFITPWFPEKVNPPSSGLIDYAVSMRPNYHKAIVDTILHYHWKEVIYIYDSHDGLLRLQQLYQILEPGMTDIKITLVKRISNTSDAIDFLLYLERKDQWNIKRIVLDCNSHHAKSILVEHVKHVRLGRRTYHYILSGLIMDDHWENEVTEYGAVNITGFRIVDSSRKIVKDFFEALRRIDSRFKGTVSAQTALMYDGVQVLMDALGRLWKKKPDAFRVALRRTAALANSTKAIDCNPGKSWVVPFEYGDKISRLIKKTDIVGLTGNISFNEAGHRCNFTLNVVEMTVQSAMVKVATWTDKQGLTLLSPKYEPLQTPLLIETNKTYIISSILQDQFLQLKPAEYGQRDQYTGFCNELIELIASDVGIKYEIRIVKDGQFGIEVADNIWNGVVGEVLRREADIAIAPITVTPEREKVVDFSEPFLSLELPVKRIRASKKLPDTFSFLRPLSKEIWFCVISSFFAVSIVLFLVSRFSPQEWRSVSVTDSHLDHPLSNTNEIILHNDFSIWNSFWFSLGSFMQQGSDVVPRSLSGRIVGTVWWFFALILVCSYTANLAAYLIVDRINDRAFMHHASRLKTENHLCPAFHLVADAEMKHGALRHYFLDKSIDCSFTLSCHYKQVDFGVVIAKGSPLREAINLSIVNMKRNGVIPKLWRKWLMAANKANCNLNKDEKVTFSEITLSQVAGIFYFLVAGLALALGVALLEFCQRGRSEAARSNVPLRTALRGMPKMSPNNRNTPQRTPQRDQDRLEWNGAAFAGYNDFVLGREVMSNRHRKMF